MGRRILFIFNFLILSGFLALNVYIYRNRNNGYAYKEYFNYRQLYELPDELRISSVRTITSDSLEIRFNTPFPNANWEISVDGSWSQGHSLIPSIKLSGGKHLYQLRDLNSEDRPVITLGFDHTPAEVYKKNNREQDAVTELYYASVPVGDLETLSPDEWQKVSPYSAGEDLALAAKLISENVPLLKDDSTLTVVKKISAFLLKELDTHRGIPADTINTVSPWTAYNLATRSGSQVWCGNFSSILSFFLFAKGIVSREVCLEGKLNSVYLAGHNLNEVFIPELKKWVLTDLTSKAIFVTYNGEYLNVIDLFELHKRNVKEMKVQTFINDSLVVTGYTEIRPFYAHYFNVAPQFVYYLKKHFNGNLYGFASKLERYFFKAPTFVSYSGYSDCDNEKFYIKQAAAIGLKLFILYLITVYVLSQIRKKQGLP